MASAKVSPLVRVQAALFDSEAETRRLVEADRDIGATVAFIGWCRGEDDRLSALELEHYPGMAETQIARHGRDAIARFALSGLSVIHRVGRIEPGEPIVLVLAASRHRQAAFDGAHYVMDYLKSTAPFWKKEHGADGHQGTWVEARDSDESALRRWGDEAKTTAGG